MANLKCRYQKSKERKVRIILSQFVGHQLNTAPLVGHIKHVINHLKTSSFGQIFLTQEGEALVIT